MSANRTTIIEVRNLHAGYGERVVLRDITFQVRRGEVFVIVGRSGSGKSTLLKHLIGLHTPRQGEIWIEGKNLISTTGEPRRGLRPRVASWDKWKRLESIGQLVSFLERHRDALLRYCRGERNVTFPRGTYLMRVRYGVACASH